MKNILISLAFLFSSINVSAHGDGEPRITIEPEGSGHYQAGQFEYDFKIFDATSNKTVSDQDLIESHTKKLHLITFDAALKEFSHVHPSFDGKIWKVMLNISKDGNYQFWAQGTLLDKTEFSANITTMIMGGAPGNQISPLGDVRTGIDRNTKIVLSNDKITAGKMAMLSFTVSRTDGQEPQLTPYLGAFAHVISTPMDGDELTHVHPMQGNKPNIGMLHATFSAEGDYRIWIQLTDRGEVKTIPLSVSVVK